MGSVILKLLASFLVLLFSEQVWVGCNFYLIRIEKSWSKTDKRSSQTSVWVASGTCQYQLCICWSPFIGSTKIGHQKMEILAGFLNT